MYFFLDLIFFFSSRRRHTRSLRDWSSDVCSSDLRPPCRRHGGAAAARDRRPAPAQVSLRNGVEGRSEERRVGKECRSRWSADHEKKNIKYTKKNVLSLNTRNYSNCNYLIQYIVYE